ncbi:hypothetical protein evm_010228 [Chilo suppressalis]|nr:hypothetical protein evm_010228 [Chilo suppressalis]
MASQRRCCVPNCNVTRADKIPMHSFPNPDIHPDRFRTWLPLTLSPHAVPTGVVPTLHLPGFGAPRSVLTDVTNRMNIDQEIEHSQLSMPSISTSGVLTEKLELQQNAVKKSKILSKNKLTASAMDQSVTNLKKVVKKLTEKNLKYTTRLKKAMKLL